MAEVRNGGEFNVVNSERPVVFGVEYRKWEAVWKDWEIAGK